ncbi:MAG TPA: HAMP domain-containing sensor histidine kinase [Granulicella sp.]
MREPASITKRLILSVLLFELLAALALITAVTVNEQRAQYKVFDANLRGTSNVLFGSVQDAEDADDSIILELHSLTLPKDAVFRVTDESGKILGAAGDLPELSLKPESFQRAQVSGRSYRFFMLTGERIIDPGQNGGVHHHVTIVYGLPDGHVWHEVLESVRFFTLSTFVLLGITALLLVWLIRRFLAPIHELAGKANEISAIDWQFHSPESARQFIELRPLASAIDKTIARLHRSFEQQRRFTSDAAHELKTDLAIVKSSLQLLAMKRRSVEEYERGLALGLDDFSRLEHTVQKMLTLARLEQPLHAGAQSCRMDEVLEEAIYQGSSLAEIRQVRILASPRTPATTPLDRRDALLLCSNVLLNALQHSPERSSVEVSSVIVDHHIRLTIRDHGEGIREEDRRFLFEPFYRGDPSRSRKSGGTGLGLSICKAICTRVGGDIDIANHPEGGAIVTITLPLTASSSEPQLSASLKA